MGRNFLVKNLGNKPCTNCSGVHEFYSRRSPHARCGTPVALSREKAEETARLEGLDINDAVVTIPDDTVVILDESARKLKQQNEASIPLDQHMVGVSVQM